MRSDDISRITLHDADDDVVAAALVGDGLDAANAQRARLCDVVALCVFARDASGAVVGGAVGRTWGECCELRQLWVDAAHRGRGLGSRLYEAFERRAIERDCRLAYLDTFSFQARPFYEARGYVVALEIRGFDAGVSKYTMTRVLRAG